MTPDCPSATADVAVFFSATNSRSIASHQKAAGPAGWKDLIHVTCSTEDIGAIARGFPPFPHPAHVFVSRNLQRSAHVPPA